MDLNPISTTTSSSISIFPKKTTYRVSPTRQLPAPLSANFAMLQIRELPEMMHPI